MQLTDATRRLQTLYSAGHRYRFIQYAHQLLRGVQHAPELALLTRQALADFGLGGPLRELIQLRRDLSPGGVDDEDLDSIPHGRVPWRSQEARFQANAAVIGRRFPHLVPLLAARATLLNELQLYRTLDGGWRLSRRRPGQIREWLEDLTAPPEHATVDLAAAVQTTGTVIAGLRVGPLVRRVFDSTRHVFLTLSRPLFLVEPDPQRFLAWMFCSDPPAILDDERVIVIVGPDAAHQLQAMLEAEPHIDLPTSVLDCTDESRIGDALQKAIQTAERTRAAEIMALQATLTDRYAGRDANYWAGRLRQRGAILGATSRFTTMLQYSMRDALHALNELGHPTQMLIEQADHHYLSLITVLRAIEALDPAAVLMLDHLRYEMPQLPAGLPVISWIQDPLSNLLNEHAGASIGTHDFVCGHYFDQCTGQFGYPAAQFLPVEMPVSTRVFHAGPIPHARASDLACDVSFVSNASVPLDVLHADLRRNLGATLAPLVDAIYRRVTDVLVAGGYLSFHRTAAELVRAAAGEIGIELGPTDVEQLKNGCAFRLFDWGRRQQTLEWVADWARATGRRLRIYGRGWEEHPSLAPFAAGAIENGAPLREANRASTLGLQLIATGFRHQRSYELIACGVLPLTRLTPVDFGELSVEAFNERSAAGDPPRCSAAQFPGFERIVFDSPAGFAALADRLLADADYRRSICDDFATVVTRQCTYEAVMRQVVAAFGDHLDRSGEPAIPAAASCPGGSPA